MKIKSINPFTGQLNAEFDTLPEEASFDAILKGREAFEKWRKFSIADRVKPIAELSSIFIRKKRELSRIITLEMGKPVKDADAEIEKCALLCDYYHDTAEKFLVSEPVQTDALKSYVVFDPLGLILGIMPWNFPFWQVVRWAVPALAAGNVCLLKHASNVPLTAVEIEKIFLESGFPEHVFKTLLISSQAAERLIEKDLVDGVSLTGSVDAGSKVGSLAGGKLKKAVFELGGSDPFMVLEDADLGQAAAAAAKSRMSNAGQSCIAAKRIIVQESVFENFREKFIEVLGGLKVGDPMDESTDIGPVAREEFVDVLSRQLDDALKKGARVDRGAAPPDQGYFFQPIAISNVSEDMLVLKEEVFGPIAVLISVRDEKEMVRIANGTEFGLGAAIWSRDIARAEKMAREIASGFVAVNGIVRSDPRLPFGGVKKSGFGRELSHYGLKEFVNVKTVIVGG